MTTLKFADTHNMVAFLSKPAESDGFEEIVNFLNAHPIRYALTVNPTIYISCIEQFWSTGVVKTINGEVQLHVLVDGKKIIISEASVRRDLKLEDEEVELGEGSAIPTDPHHTPTIIESSSQPQKIQKPRKPKRNDTQIPQPSDPSDNVVDEAIHKELGDSLMKANTTASGLEAEQDSGGGPRCQETMGDTIVQTRFENVSKLSNDSLLARGNTLRSDEDRLKLNKLMELCTTLPKKILDLEMTKTTQANEIVSLKRRVKKLEKKRSSRTHILKRLYKVGLSVKVESSGDEEDLEMFDVDALDGEEVFVAWQNENVVEEVVDAAQVSTTATTVTITTEEITLSQALATLKTSKPKLNLMNKKELAEKEKQANIALTEEWDDIHAKIEVDHELAQRLQAQDSKKQKVDDNKETTEIEQCMEIIPDEEESTFLDDATCADLHAGRKEISPYITYNYRYVEQEALGRIVRIKSLLNAASITAAHIRVNAAQLC
ncbi:hypothetical protein Tco_0798598 [Tanacetum coccineum]